jgi:hypothetical protein
MKISQLPQEVKEKALEYQKNSNKYWDKKTDKLEYAFDWENSEEGEGYWKYWEEKKFKETVK